MTNTIKLPPNWDADKDLKFFEVRWGESQNYSKDAHDRLANEYVGLGELLDAAITHLQDLNPRFVAINPRCLSFQEKAERLTLLVRGSNREAGYQERFLESCRECQWVEKQRKRILRNYLPDSENSWLYPLVELTDAMACAAYTLDETLRCEHPELNGTR